MEVTHQNCTASRDIEELCATPGGGRRRGSYGWACLGTAVSRARALRREDITRTIPVAFRSAAQLRRGQCWEGMKSNLQFL